MNQRCPPSLDANTFAPGPTSGQFITPNNGITPPFIDKQPVQGFSAVLQGPVAGSYYVMPDNGFGTKANSDLQKSYAQSWGSSRIYTPQLIVNGSKGVVGSRDNEVSDALGAAALNLPVGITVGDNMLNVTVGPQAGGANAMVWLVTFKDHAQVAIGRGENAGKTVDYTQIVTSRQMLGMWDPAAGTHLKLPLATLEADGSNGAAILVQTEKDGLPGTILGAASVKL